MMGNKPSRRCQKPATKVSSIFPSAAEGKSYDYLYKVLLTGDWGTGKTCTSRRFAAEYDAFSETYFATIGIDFKIRSANLDGNRLKLMLWDTSGQERFRTITQAYYRGCQGFIIFYDATRQKTFDNVCYWIEEVKKYGSPDVTVMLVGAKTDLSEGKVVAYETAKDFADENDIMFFEVSAKDGTNTDLALMTLVAAIRERHCELATQDVHVV